MGSKDDEEAAWPESDGGGSVSAPLVSAPRIAGLAPEHQAVLDRLVDRLVRKSARNRLRRRYYDYKNTLRDLGISIPPQLKHVETVVGWPAKAVDAMSRRTILEEFYLDDGGSTADLGLDALLEANRLAMVAPQAHTSALIHATAFGFVTAGDTAAGEPEALLTVRSAEWATATWDDRRRAVSEALSVVSVDDSGTPDHFVIYVPNLAIIARREGTRWDLRQVRHDLGVPCEPIPYRPSLDRPFGSSRISRPVMALTDSAVRTLLRTEVAAEFYNAPQRYVLGADADAFGGKSGWEVMLGRLLLLSRDEDGNLPTTGQYPQQSMEPNIAHFRMLAQAFASETSLPLRSLGVVGDNPESAEAIVEANKELELEIRHWEDATLKGAWKRLAVLMLRILDDTPAARERYAALRARFADPTTVSVIARADAFVKTAAAIPSLAETSVGLELAGLTQEQVERHLSELRRAAAPSVLERILSGRLPESDATRLEEK